MLDIKWALTLLGPLLAYLGRIIYKEWIRNREKFENEYNKILSELIDVHGIIKTVKLGSGIANFDPNSSLHRYLIEDNLGEKNEELDRLIDANRNKIEDDLIEDWKEVHSSIRELESGYGNKGTSNSKLLKSTFSDVEELKNKVESYYSCHFHRRLIYRIKNYFS